MDGILTLSRDNIVHTLAMAFAARRPERDDYGFWSNTFLSQYSNEQLIREYRQIMNIPYRIAIRLGDDEGFEEARLITPVTARSVGAKKYPICPVARMV